MPEITLHFIRCSIQNTNSINLIPGIQIKIHLYEVDSLLNMFFFKFSNALSEFYFKFIKDMKPCLIAASSSHSIVPRKGSHYCFKVLNQSLGYQNRL